MDMFDNRFLTKEFLMEPCIAMSWRVDVRKVPSKALIQYSREAEEKIKAMEELEYLPKKRRREIKEGVRITLLKRAIPRSRTYDMIWNIQTGVLFFGATGKTLCDDFSEFFLQCFSLHLKSVFPYTIATGILEKDKMDPTLIDGLRPSINAEVA
ncbi:MAG: recombination-associated protein RdgC [Deltaproteobacteria bacterium]|nr:recombination-associated protein RdgC [Deltaproteobacteria bacterium]